MMPEDRVEIARRKALASIAATRAHYDGLDRARKERNDQLAATIHAAIEGDRSEATMGLLNDVHVQGLDPDPVPLVDVLSGAAEHADELWEILQMDLEGLRGHAAPRVEGLT